MMLDSAIHANNQIAAFISSSRREINYIDVKKKVIVDNI